MKKSEKIQELFSAMLAVSAMFSQISQARDVDEYHARWGRYNPTGTAVTVPHHGEPAAGMIAFGSALEGAGVVDVVSGVSASGRGFGVSLSGAISSQTGLEGPISFFRPAFHRARLNSNDRSVLERVPAACFQPGMHVRGMDFPDGTVVVSADVQNGSVKLSRQPSGSPYNGFVQTEGYVWVGTDPANCPIHRISWISGNSYSVDARADVRVGMAVEALDFSGRVVTSVAAVSGTATIKTFSISGGAVGVAMKSPRMALIARRAGNRKWGQFWKTPSLSLFDYETAKDLQPGLRMIGPGVVEETRVLKIDSNTNTLTLNRGTAEADVGGASEYAFYASPVYRTSVTKGLNTLKLTTTQGLNKGQLVSGPGIPSGTLIQSLWTDEKTITLSKSLTRTEQNCDVVVGDVPMSAGFILNAFEPKASLPARSDVISIPSTSSYEAGDKLSGPFLDPAVEVKAVLNSTQLKLSIPTINQVNGFVGFHVIEDEF